VYNISVSSSWMRYVMRLHDCYVTVQDEQRISGSSEQQWEEFAHPAVRSLACSYHL
jgi:hypothetical protein